MNLRVLKQVFKHVRYSLVAVGVAFIVLSAALLLSNISVIIQVFSSSAVTLIEKFVFLLSLYGSLITNFTILTGLYLLIISALFGVNIALLTYYIRRRKINSKNSKAELTSIGGILSAVLGIGCAACGSVILTAILGIFGAGSLIILLPLKGMEFGILGLFLLGFSTVYLLKRINDPLICR